MTTGRRAGLACALLAAGLLAWPATGLAQSERGTDPGGLLDRLAGLTDSDALSIGGLGFVRYWYQLDGPDDEVDTNSFELYRMYLTVKARMTSWLSMRLTIDAGPESEAAATTGPAQWTTDPPPEGYDHTHPVSVPGDRSYGVFVKFAYFDVALPLDLAIRAGVIPTVWTGLLDDFWGFRFVASEVTDEEKLQRSADVGASLRWKMPLRLGNVEATFLNGTGFKRSLDGDTDKTLAARLTLTPFASCCEILAPLELGALASVPLAQEEASGAPRNVFAAFVGYRHDWFRVGYQFFYQDDRSGDTDREGMGHAAYLRFETPWGVGLLGRFHVWDSDVADDANQRTMKLLAGAFYSPVRYLTVAVTDAVVWTADDTDAADPPTENTLFVSSEFRF
ncbi:MAG: hypothetical protein JXB32_02025 [Deltaproteobacteria bacterium]|nr:hypothetical protein [Deltaproteobacteria bacterium]